MWCPQCGKDTRVVETEKLTDTVTRVRWCRNGGCKLLFETRESLTEKLGGESKGEGAAARAGAYPARDASGMCKRRPA
ncbi:MAG: hypothetical protein ACOZEN_11060 [Thermodesulfobacteriota bacterium]